MKTALFFLAFLIFNIATVYSQEIPDPSNRIALSKGNNGGFGHLNKEISIENVRSTADDSIYVSSILWTQFNQVKVRDQYAYCISTNGLVILNISAKSKPEKISQLYFGENGGDGRDIYLSGNYAYIADGDAGLLIVDISNPLLPVMKGNYNTTSGTLVLQGSAIGVTVSGNYAYVACGTEGLQIINVSNPTSPTLTGHYRERNFNVKAVSVSGNYAYAAAGDDGLLVVDISDPALPYLIARYDSPGSAVGISVNGNYAYVADYYAGLQIVNISTPSKPARIGNYPESARDVTVSGNYAYTVDFYLGLNIINISNPSSPILMGNIRGYSGGVSVSGNYAFIATGSNLDIIDISNPSSPTLKGSYGSSGEAYDVYVSGNYAYVADGWAGLQIIDISNPLLPVVKGNYTTEERALGVTVSGNHAYVAGDAGLFVINISNPSSPTLTGSYNGGSARGVTVSGNYAYVANPESGLLIINISNPSSPKLTGSYNEYGAQGVAVSGNYAYLATGHSELAIIDISNPSSPTLVATKSSLLNLGYSYGVTVSGNYAYVVKANIFSIIDIGNPSNPVSTDYFGVVEAKYVTVSGNYAYVGDSGYGFRIFNLSNPLIPRKVERESMFPYYNTRGIAGGVAVSGNYAYIADYTSLLILKLPAGSAGGSLNHFNAAYTATGNASTVLVKNVNIKAAAWSVNDEVGIFTPSGLCAGAGVYTGSDLRITVWADNSKTSSIVEGFTAGQTYTFRIWDASAGLEYNATATASSGNLSYSNGGNTELSALNSASIDSAAVVSQKVNQDSTIGASFANGTSLNIKFNSGSVNGKTIAIKSLGTVLPSGVITPAQSIPVKNVVEYMNLTIDTATTFTGTISVGYADSVLTVRGINESKLVLAYYDSTTNAWISLTTTVDTVNNIASATIRHFSYWVLGDNSTTSLLPVELNNFLADVGIDNNVHLRWNTSSETNNLGFSVERSTDKKIWEKVGFIDGNGTSTLEHVYTYQDKSLESATYYYRLAQTDFDGSITYSEIVKATISIPDEFALSQNYPNPFNPTTTIEYQLPKATSVKMTIYNLLGQAVLVLVNDFKPAGSYSVVWDGRNNAGLQLSSGVYIYRIQAGSFNQIRKMILMK